MPKIWRGHAAVVSEGLGGLVISGGRDQKLHSLDDMFLLSFKDWKWRKILLSKSSPTQRERHALLNLCSFLVTKQRVNYCYLEEYQCLTTRL